MNKVMLYCVVGLVGIGGVIYFNRNRTKENILRKVEINEQSRQIKVSEIPIPTKKPIVNFPFTVQAPNGDWKNPIFQDGCEEATVLMIICAVWENLCPVENGVIETDWASDWILRASEWEREKFGSSTDTSAADTASRLLEGYSAIKQFEVVKLTSSESLKRGVWIVPMDGQKLNNPHYSGLGPERHMVLVIGYDNTTDEIITNDAGTKYGKGYRYKIDKFWQAIRDYPTGIHEPITKVEKNAILVKV